MNNFLYKIKVHLKNDGLKYVISQGVEYIFRKTGMQSDRKFDYFEREHETIPIHTQTVYMIASIPYYDIGGGQRCAQLAKTFIKMGYSVKYLYNQGSGDKKHGKTSMPLDMHVLINRKSIQYVKKHAKKDDIFIFELPMKKFAPLLDIAIERECKIVYENIDNWESTLGCSFFNEEILKKMLSSAHLLVGTARPLVEQLEQYLERFHIKKEQKKIEYLANAVDEELFCGKKEYEIPSDLKKGKCTLMYYGSLWGEWFSWDIVIGLAKRHPEYSICLIGNTSRIHKIMEECPENIHFLGLKAQVDLPAYLQHVDYALLPFEKGIIGDYVSPLKIFEYISMYTKVLCTSLPDIQGYPNLYFGDTIEEWEEIIEKEYPVDKIAADNFIQENTWESRVKSMLKSLDM